MGAYYISDARGREGIRLGYIKRSEGVDKAKESLSTRYPCVRIAKPRFIRTVSLKVRRKGQPGNRESMSWD